MADEGFDTELTDVALPGSDEVEVEITQATAETETETEAEAAPESPPPQAAPEAVPVDPDLAGDDEYNAFAPKIQKRIQREIRIRRQAEAAANMAVAKAQEHERAVITEAAAVRELRTANAELQRQYAEVLAHTFGTQIELKVQALKAARSAGEFDTEQTLQGEVDELRFKQSQVKEIQRTLPQAPASPAPAGSAPAPTPAPTPAPAPRAAVVNPIAAKWIRDNDSWFNNAKFEAHREFVLRLDKQVAAEGYDQGSSEYYKELDRRVDSAFPTLRRKTPMATSKSGPVASVSSSTSATRSSKVVLTQSDLANMRRYNLDPDNKVHLTEYAKQLRDANAKENV